MLKPEHTGTIQHSGIRKSLKPEDENDSMNTIALLLQLLPFLPAQQQQQQQK